MRKQQGKLINRENIPDSVEPGMQPLSTKHLVFQIQKQCCHYVPDGGVSDIAEDYFSRDTPLCLAKSADKSTPCFFNTAVTLKLTWMLTP